MGAKGSTMKDIRHRSRAVVTVNEQCEDGTDERNVMVQGSLANVQSAACFRYDLVSNCV